METEIETVETVAPLSEPKAKAKRKAGGRPKGARTHHINPAIMVETPEFKAIVAKAVELATADLKAQLDAKRVEHGTAEQPGDVDWARRLAAAIGEVADQGTNRKRVPPAVLQARKEAFERMSALILDYRAQDVMPEYELVRPVYLNEELVPPTYTDRDHIMRRTKIEWHDVPNEGMTPANAAAKAIYAEFMAWIGGPTSNVTRLTDKIVEKKPHTGLKVLHRGDGPNEATQVAIPRNAGVTKLGRRQAGDVIETHVLGTTAEPARQIA